MYIERISHMTDSETFEIVGRKREEYRARKKERAALMAKAGEMAKTAGAIHKGLTNPQLIRWFEGVPFMGLRQEHVVLNPAWFVELTEENVKQICGDIKRVEAVLVALRQELTALDEDPGIPW